MTRLPDGKRNPRFPPGTPLCWWCSSKLVVPGYRVIKDQLGNEVKVHQCCKPTAEEAVAAARRLSLPEGVTSASPATPRRRADD